MSQLKLEIGTVLIIGVDFTKESEKYKSKVIDMGEGYVMIDYPTDVKTGKTAFLMDGTQLLISFTDKMKMSFAFKTEVLGRTVQGVPMLKVSYQGDDKLMKIQRREFVRVDTSMDVSIEKDGARVQLTAEDISAGGIALNISKTDLVETNDVLSLLIVLPFVNHEIKYIQTKGKVVRTWDDHGRKIASIKFEDVNPTDRQRIVRFCFERELQKRNKL